jgi:PEP-CTERM motif
MHTLSWRLSCIAVAAAAGAAGLASWPAAAMVTLETHVSDISCGITSAAGETTFSDCDSLSFAASVQPGQAAFLRGTLNYHYTDDGLPLPVRQAIQVYASGFNMIPLTYEAGALYFASNDCSDSRYCSIRPGVNISGTRFTPSLVLGVNDQPDDISGSKDLFITVGVPQDTPLGYASTLFVSFRPMLFAAPVPEPATVALMSCGLLALGAMARRRRVWAR